MCTDPAKTADLSFIKISAAGAFCVRLTRSVSSRCRPNWFTVRINCTVSRSRQHTLSWCYILHFTVWLSPSLRKISFLVLYVTKFTEFSFPQWRSDLVVYRKIGHEFSNTSQWVCGVSSNTLLALDCGIQNNKGKHSQKTAWKISRQKGLKWFTLP